MTIPRLSTEPLLTPDDVEPAYPGMKVIGVFNPGAVRVGNDVVLLIRVAESPVEQREGHHALPTLADGELNIEYVPEDQDILKDPRKIVRASDKLMRLKFVSTLRAYRLTHGRTEPTEIGRLLPRTADEAFGVEDARITQFPDQPDTFWITYVSVSERCGCTSLASTKDFKSYERHGVIFVPDNKDVVIFPEKFDGRFAALHRPNAFQRFGKPSVWTASSADLIDWGRHRFFYAGQNPWEADRVGAGTVPLKTDRGWLTVYHGSGAATDPGKVGRYCAGLMLHDLADPTKLIGRTPEPFMEPEHDFEQSGFVPDVVFPTGLVPDPLRPEHVLVYYGAADTCTAMTSYPLTALLDACDPVG